MGNAHPNSITHSPHPGQGHTLRKITTAFHCNGCHEPGEGDRYRCEPCNYNLHICCAPLEGNLEHPQFMGCILKLDQTALCHGCYCNACGDSFPGSHYSNRERNVDLHPLCAFLPERVEHDGIEFRLETSTRMLGKCIICQQHGPRDSFWYYKSEDGEGGEPVYMHLACLKLKGTAVQVGQSSALTVAGQGMQLQTVSASRSRWLNRVYKFIKIFAKIVYATATLDPAAVASLGSDVYQALTS